MYRLIKITIMPIYCQHRDYPKGPKCFTKIRRIKRKSWRKGYHECPKGHHDWYGGGIKKTIKKRILNNARRRNN